MLFPRPLIIEPSGHCSADATVIILHGANAQASDFEALIHALQLPGDLAVRFVLPQAPTRAITAYDDRTMAAWYDTFDASLRPWIDKVHLDAAAAYVHSLIEVELAKGIDSRRIIVAGFAQGGTVAYQAALTAPQPLGGLLVMSAYLVMTETLPRADADAPLSIEVHHGVHDPAIAEPLGLESIEHLEALGYAPIYRTYDMAHGFCAEQLIQARRWLIQRLGATTLMA